MGRMRAWVHALFLVVLAASGPVAGGVGPAGAPVSPADFTTIVKYLGSDAADLDAKQDLDVTKVDLNDDKRPDYIVVSKSSIYCGSGGCSVWVLMSDGDGYRNVAPEILVFKLTVADTRTKGVLDLLWEGRGGDRPILLTWDGNTYKRAQHGK
jgi:hypothetical protein